MTRSIYQHVSKPEVLSHRELLPIKEFRQLRTRGVIFVEERQPFLRRAPEADLANRFRGYAIHRL
jgi:hypothetical protein